MSARCEDTGLDPRTCGHCLGLTEVNLDSAKVVELTVDLDTSELEAAVERATRPAPRPTGKRSKLQRLLESIPDVYAQLGDALHGTRAGGEGERVTGGGGDSRPAPLQLQVAELRHQLLHDLRWWVSNYAQPVQPVVGDHVGAMAALLLCAEGYMDEDDREALTGTLEDLHRTARILTDLPRLRGSIPLPAKCLNADPATQSHHADLAEWERELLRTWSCDGELRAMLPADRSRHPWLSCKACGARWDVTELPEAANVRLPVYLAAELLDVSVRTIQRRAGRDAGTVRLGDALAVDA